MAVKIKKVCSSCGSDSLEFDANAEWDINLQEMVLISSFDHVVCNDCGGETSCTDVELTSEDKVMLNDIK